MAGTTLTVTAQCFDLTIMFGAGNEPATVAEFEKMFPADYYEYNAGELLSAGVSEVQSMKGDGMELASLAIPSAVQNLPGYGWSAGTAKNWVDWDNRVYHREVAAVDMESLAWYVNTGAGGPEFRASITGALSMGYTEKANIVCPKYITATREQQDYKRNTIPKSISLTSDSLIAVDDSYTTAQEFKAAMSGVPLYYELATPELINISDLLTDDNLISVQEGGVLTFKNTLGEGFCIPVPSDVAYTLKLGSKEGTA